MVGLYSLYFIILVLVSVLFIRVVGVITFFLISEDPLRMGLRFGVYSGLVSIILIFEEKRFFGCLLFWVFVGTMLVIFCIVVRIAPNPVFRLFSVFLLFISYIVYILTIEMFSLEYDVLLVYLVGGSGFFSSKVVISELGFDYFRDFWWVGGVYSDIGVFDGIGWGSLLIYRSIIIILRVISVVNLCNRSSGSLVRFVVKS